MELRHLRYFVAVAEQGNVSRAARKLFIAQPPLSAQLRQLEEEVGAQLFTRHPRGVRLTLAGESLLEDARAILARAQQAPLRARERQQSRQSVVRLGLVPSAMHSLLPDLLLRIEEGRWNVRVEAREMITSQQLQALRSGELDLSFGRPAGGVPPPEEQAGIDDPYCLAVHPTSPLAAADEDAPLRLQDLAHTPFVGFTRYREADYFDQTIALCVDAGFTPSIRHEAGQFVNVLALVACGLGVAIVPSSFAALYRGKVVFRPLEASRYQSRMAVLCGPAAMPDANGLASSDTARVAQAAIAVLREFERKLKKMKV